MEGRGAGAGRRAEVPGATDPGVLVLRLAFLGANQAKKAGNWNHVVARHGAEVFPALAGRRALLHVRGQVEAAERVERMDLRIAGYSWGAWTALRVASALLARPRRIHHRLGRADLSITLGSLDPVASFRLPVTVPEDPRLRIYNLYQRNGCYRDCPGPSRWFRGRELPRAVENLDVTTEGRDRPMVNGVPPDFAPDHYQLGYVAWGRHDEYVASVLEHGAAGPRRP